MLREKNRHLQTFFNYVNYFVRSSSIFFEKFEFFNLWRVRWHISLDVNILHRVLCLSKITIINHRITFALFIIFRNIDKMRGYRGYFLQIYLPFFFCYLVAGQIKLFIVDICTMVRSQIQNLSWLYRVTLNLNQIEKKKRKNTEG